MLIFGLFKMDIKDFEAGTFQQQYHYKSFLPTAIDRPWQINDGDLTMLLSVADIKLGELNAF